MRNSSVYLVRWFRCSVLNLWIVSLLGLLMRFKILFPLPWFDQRNILHAHSHFAFAGWITQAIFCLMIDQMSRLQTIDERKYNRILWANQLTALGMLFSFPFTGYGPVAIIFSTLSIFVSYWFAWVYWKDLQRCAVKPAAANWFKAALLFLAISSLGPFFLAYMMATHQVQSNAYLASVYYYLHFQYNGWFFFACMGLMVQKLANWGAWKQPPQKIFLAFAIACVPAYFLSALWLPIPFAIYLLVVAAVVIQNIGWGYWLTGIYRKRFIIVKHISPLERWLFFFAALACSIKLILQSGSVIPSLSKLAFGFRPIVIGYLHLVLLGIISIFLLAMGSVSGLLYSTTGRNHGLRLFVGAVIFNEFLLMLQGIADMSYRPLPWINHLLLLAGILLFVSIGWINLSGNPANYAQKHKIPA